MTSAAGTDGTTKARSATAISWVDRPLRRAMLTNAASPPYFNIERGSARSTFSICGCNELRRCCGRRSGRAKIEIHGRRSLRARLRREKWSWRKTEHARDQIGRETAYRDVVVLHRGVEIPPFDRDPVLGSFQLCLQAEKILVCAQFRITLDHHQQTRERIAQLPLSSLELLQLRRIGGRLVWVELHTTDAGACIRYFDEGRFLDIRR